MERQLILNIVEKHFPVNTHSVTLTMSANYSPQPETLNIQWEPEHTPLFQTIGAMIDEIEGAIIDDEYGDIVEMTLEYITYNELPDDEVGVQQS